MPIESGGAQTTRTPDDGTDARAFAASEDAAKQRTGARAKNGVLNALSASPTRFDSAFDVYLLAGRCMIQLNDFGMNRRTAPVGHNQAVELQDHAGVAVNSAGHVNVDDVAVDAGALVLALVDDGGTEGVAHLGVDAGQRVIEANAEGHVIGDGEGLS